MKGGSENHLTDQFSVWSNGRISPYFCERPSRLHQFGPKVSGDTRCTWENLERRHDKSAVAIVKSARQLGCVSQDSEPPESVTISRKGTKVLGPIRRVRFTRATLRQANIRKTKVHH